MALFTIAVIFQRARTRIAFDFRDKPTEGHEYLYRHVSCCLACHTAAWPLAKEHRIPAGQQCGWWSLQPPSLQIHGCSVVEGSSSLDPGSRILNPESLRRCRTIKVQE